MLADFRLKRVLFAIGDNSGTDLAGVILATFQDSHDCGLILAARASDAPRTLPWMHVSGLAADESLVGFNMAGEFPQFASAESEPDSMVHEPCGFLRARKPCAQAMEVKHGGTIRCAVLLKM